MPKKADDMPGRLERAALALFHEQGYERTTTAGIAAWAGVTERTFYRYFPDKREVLFNGQAMVQGILMTAIETATPQLGPLATLFYAFGTMVPSLEANRQWLAERHDVILATPALHEREVAKMAALADALALALQARGVAQVQAVLAARIGMAAFNYAISAWFQDAAVGIDAQLELAEEQVTLLLK